MATFCFPKSARLLKGFQFKTLSQKAFCFKGKVLCIFWKPTQSNKPQLINTLAASCSSQVCPPNNGGARLGITVTKKYGKAHARNRFKRHVREAFRHLAPSCSMQIDMNVRPIVAAKAATMASAGMISNFADVYADIERFFRSL